MPTTQQAVHAPPCRSGGYRAASRRSVHTQRTQSRRETFSDTIILQQSGAVVFNSPAAAASASDKNNADIEGIISAAAAASGAGDLTRMLQMTMEADCPKSIDMAAALHATDTATSTAKTPQRAVSNNTTGSCSLPHQALGSVRATSSSSAVPSVTSYQFQSEVTRTVTMEESIMDRATQLQTPRSGGSASGNRGAFFGSEFSKRQMRPGAQGELFACEWLKHQLPGFDDSCWHSHNITYAGLPMLRGGDPPYDFAYKDVTGAMSGEAGTVCFIEVKSTSSTSATMSMPITVNEWEVACKLHTQPVQGGVPFAYFIIRVIAVGSAVGPKVAAVWADPVKRWLDGHLLLESNQLILTPTGAD